MLQRMLQCSLFFTFYSDEASGTVVAGMIHSSVPGKQPLLCIMKTVN